MSDDLDDDVRQIQQIGYLSIHLNRVQVQELQAINRSLASMLRELGDIRRIQQVGVELLGAILARDTFQASMEEFVFRFRRSLGEFRDENTGYPVEAQFLYLQQMLEVIQRCGISTACIRGLENKAAFDTCLSEAFGIHQTLIHHPDVQKALRSAETDRQQQNALKMKKTVELISQRHGEEISRLKKRLKEIRKRLKEIKDAHKDSLTFHDWYSDQVFIIRILLWLLGGFIWIPLLYLTSKPLTLDQKNAEFDAECDSIRQRIAHLESVRSRAANT